ncbi:MAG TPA: trypsin-like peptidase domain-containing protein [Aggregatilineales bacterium]|nr:trypsin-like peptidase domain-containing protein [Aggregatilineales bacterium]
MHIIIMKIKAFFSVMILIMLFGSLSIVNAADNTILVPYHTISQEELELPDLYDLASDSVVFIEIRAEEDLSAGFLPTGGLGTGFVYDTEGHIITNNHVIEDASLIDVTFFDGLMAHAEVVGIDPDSDIAVIKVDVPTEFLHPVVMGDSGQLRVGEDVVAIGNPFGQSWTMTTGIVSALGRSNRAITGFSIAQMIQTDAAINPGNSGGPLLNRQGQVIGMNTMIFSEEGVSSGVGFAVPVNTIKRVVPELIQNGSVQYTWIGISGGDITLDVIDLMGLDPGVRGVLISRISSGSPAEQAGLLESSETQRINGRSYAVGGDIITSINGVPIHGIDELIGYLADNTRPGDMVNVTIIRDGAETVIPVTLEARPSRAR